MIEWTKYPYTIEWAFTLTPCDHYLHAPPSWNVLWKSEEENLQITLVKNANTLGGFISHLKVSWKPEWMGRVEDSAWGRIIENHSEITPDPARELMSIIEWTKYPGCADWIFTKTPSSYWINNQPDFTVLFEDDTCQIALIRDARRFTRERPDFSRTVIQIPWRPSWMELCLESRWMHIIATDGSIVENIPPPTPIMVVPFVGMELFQRLSGLSEEKIKLVLKCR